MSSRNEVDRRSGVRFTDQRTNQAREGREPDPKHGKVVRRRFENERDFGRNAHVQHVGDPKPEGGQEHRWIGAHDERAGEEVRERVTLVRVTFGYANAVSSPEAWLRAIDRVGPDLITDVYRLREEHDLH